jgi:hypothetical protein
LRNYIWWMKNNATIKLNMANSTVLDVMENGTPKELIAVIMDDSGAPITSMILTITDETGCTHRFGISNKSISYSIINL